MSKTGGDEDDEGECFYESLDRIASSSCSCSTSSSSDEQEEGEGDRLVSDSPNYAKRNHFPIPKFPMRVSKFDVWISQPSSVSERRRDLLRDMGLSGDPSLSRASAADADAGELSRSASSGHLSGSPGGSLGMVRSKSDGGGRCPALPARPDSAEKEACSEVSVFVNNSSSPSLNKPPSGKKEIQVSSNQNSGEEEACTIRDLDNGKEFVVKEIKEDGTWDKLKEVGTGRHLTMEEFQMCVGHSPIVQELMRRQSVEEAAQDGGPAAKKKGDGWLRSLKSSMGRSVQKERRSSDESSEKGSRRSSSATDDSQDAASFHGPERVKVKQYGKPAKDLATLFKTQEIHAHKGSVWTIKFSLDGRHLASAGEDCVIHIWQVVDSEKKGDLLVDKAEDGNMFFVANGSPEPSSMSPGGLDGNPEKKKRGRASISRKSVSLDHVFVPDTVFGLSEKPVSSFQGHLDDVLDLSWSKSQHLLSSSMDKTVRLWHLSTKTCLKIFSHSDYVTCIQFNPVDDRYFISGSLDAKVRIWSIPDRQVVDWNDLHEMVTAACYTPDGQGALVGSYKGSCRLYNTVGNKLQQKSQINLQNKKKKSRHKKITGFQFAPGSSSEVLITSSDSRIRVVDGVDLVHKFKGFRNANTQISASLTENGRYVVAASEDSHVYIWKHEVDSRPGRSKAVTVTRSYEHFHCQDVSAAIPWPGMADLWDIHQDERDEVSTANHPPTPVEEASVASANGSQSPHGTISSASNSYFFDRIAATWPEEKLPLAARNRSPRVSLDFGQNVSAWGLVIVTAGLRGEIRTFQNFGLPIRI